MYHYKIIIILLTVAIVPFLVVSVYSANLFLRYSINMFNSKNEFELIRTGAFMEKTLQQSMEAILSEMADEQYTKMQSILDKMNIHQHLTKVTYNNKYVDQAFLFNEDEGYLLVSNYGIVSDLQNSPYRWINDDIVKMANYQVKVTGTKSLVSAGQKKYIVSLIAKLPMQGTQAFLIFNVNMEALYHDFLRQLNINSDVYNYYLKDVSDIVIFHQDYEQLGSSGTQEKEPLTRTGRLVVNSYKLPTMGWSLVSEVDTSNLYRDIFEVRNKIILLLLISLFIILFMIFLGTRLLYRPVKMVIAKTTALFTGKIDEKQGEFEFLSSAFEDVVKTNRHLKLETEQLMKKTLVYNLIKDRFILNTEDIDHYLHGYRTDLVVVYFTINDQTECSMNNPQLICQVENDLGTSFEIDLFIESEREFIVLFRLRRDDLNTFITGLLSTLDDRITKSLTISIGSIHPLDKINNSYTEALYAYNMGRIYSGHTNIYCYNKLPIDYQNNQMSDPAFEELELAVRQHNEKAYCDLLHMMFSENRSLMEYNYNLYMNISLLIRLYDHESVKFLREMNELITDKGIMNAVYVKQFLISKFKGYNTDYRKDFNDYVQKVKAYIAEHYATNFSMDDLAEHVGVTRQYISQLFKKQYNTTLIDYVTQYRVEQAKQLLANTSMKVSEVGSKAGFNSKSYFTKVFKLNTGITPSEYRELAWNRIHNKGSRIALNSEEELAR